MSGIRRFLLVCAILTLPAIGYAQEAVINGTVTDSSGAVLPGVTMTATNEATGNTFVAVTDATGVATVKYEPRATGDHQISIEYLVDGEGRTGASAVISVAGGTTQLYHSSSGIQIPGLNVGVLMAVLATIWAILLSVALRVIVIAHAGSDNSASETGPAGRTVSSLSKF